MLHLIIAYIVFYIYTQHKALSMYVHYVKIKFYELKYLCMCWITFLHLCCIQSAFIMLDNLSVSLPPQKHTDQLPQAVSKEVTPHFLLSINLTQVVTVDTRNTRTENPQHQWNTTSVNISFCDPTDPSAQQNADQPTPIVYTPKQTGILCHKKNPQHYINRRQHYGHHAQVHNSATQEAMLYTPHSAQRIADQRPFRNKSKCHYPATALPPLPAPARQQPPRTITVTTVDATAPA
jgi:hypothetical protein